jgi:hypothetical protein
MSTTSERSDTGVLRDYLISFAPWIAYILVLQAANSWRFGFAVGLTIAALIVVMRVTQGDSRFLDVGTLVYCGVMTMVSVLDPTSPLKPYNVPLSLTAIGFLSVASLLMHSPFTYRIERNHVPAHVLQDSDLHRHFYRVHVIATSSWAVSQGTAAAIGAILIHAKLTPGATVVQTIGTLTPIGMTRFHHERFLQSVEDERHGEGAPAQPEPG